MPKLLILTFTYPPNKDGVAEASRAMAEGLAARGFDVTICTTFHPQRDTGGQEHGVKVRQFKVTGSSQIGVGFHGAVEEYLAAIKAFSGDLVISHCWDVWTTDLARRCFPQVTAKKLLVSHGFSTQVPPWHRRFPWGLGVWLRWQPYVWKLPWMLRAYDHMTVLSKLRNFDRFFDHWVAWRTRYRRVTVIPNSADLPRSVTMGFRAKHRLERLVVFLCVANYCTRKNQELALRAFRKALLPGAALVFIGSEFNDYSQTLLGLDGQLTAGGSPSNVLFLEGLSRDETSAAFQECDVFVLSAKIETQPIVLLEAMASAKPFISTDTGCVRELEGGRVVNSEAEFTREIVWLAEDADGRRRLGDQGRTAFLKSYTSERVLDDYEKLIMSLIRPEGVASKSASIHASPLSDQP